MWSQLIEDILLELKLLRRLLEQTRVLRQTIAEGAPSETEKLAAASLLQSFYNGVENVFDALADRLDGGRPTGAKRHRTLLDKLAAKTDARPAVLSKDLRDGLRHYLEFRNSYRYSHYFRLDWTQMASLVSQCEATLDRLEADLDQFVREHAQQRFLGRPEPEGLPAYWFAPPEQARPPQRQRFRAVLLLVAFAGVLVGALGVDVVRRLHGPQEPQRISTSPLRELSETLIGQLRPWRDEPTIEHVIGVLEFFVRESWLLTYAANGSNDSGDVTGRCESLGASATIALLAGEIVRIELRTPYEHYVFSVSGRRLVRAVQYGLPSGRPQRIAEFDPAGRPVRLAADSDRNGQPVWRERSFRGGKLVLETFTAPDRSLDRLTIRTGPDPNQTTTFAPTEAGAFAPDPNEAARANDLRQPDPNERAGT